MYNFINGFFSFSWAHLTRREDIDKVGSSDEKQTMASINRLGRPVFVGMFQWMRRQKRMQGRDFCRKYATVTWGPVRGVVIKVEYLWLRWPWPGREKERAVHAIVLTNHKLLSYILQMSMLLTNKCAIFCLRWDIEISSVLWNWDITFPYKDMESPLSHCLSILYR